MIGFRNICLRKEKGGLGTVVCREQKSFYLEVGCLRLADNICDKRDDFLL